MAEIRKELDSVIKIDGQDYSVTAEKVAHSLTIKRDGLADITFNGSADAEIYIDALASSETANKIQVTMDNDVKQNATITIKSSDPTITDGAIGDIWFKY